MSLHRNWFFLFLLISLVVVGLAGLTWMNARFGEQNPGGNDFLARWNGARMWVVEGISPYAPEVGENTQRIIYGRLADPAKGEDQALFAYPLYSMLFFAPLGPLDYPTARVIWMTISEVCLILIGWLSLRISGWKVSVYGLAFIFLFSLLWYCGARGVILGQFSIINSLMILAAFYLIQKKKDLDAGLILALSTSKPQMSFLMVIFAFVWSIFSRRGKLALGIIGGMAFLCILSFVFLPSWLSEWFWQLVAYPSYTNRIGSVVSIVAGALPGIEEPLSIMLYAIAVIYLLGEWIVSIGKDDRWFVWTGLITLVVTNLIAPRTATPHYIDLIPAFFLLFRAWQERWGKTGQLAAWISMLVALVGLWVLFIITVKGNDESALMYLPVPALALLALWWARWWLLRRQRIYFDEYPI